MNQYQTQKSEAPSYGEPKKSNLINRLLAGVYCGVAFVAIINLVGTNALATQGIVLDKIMQDTQKISKENQNLRLEIEKKSNLSYIESEADKLGFKRIKSNLTLLPAEAVAAAITR